MTLLLKTHPVIKIISGALVNLPSPANLSSWWNFGSLLGLCLGTQILSGFFLAMHYTGSTNLAFESLIHIAQDVNSGNLLRTIHANGASFFFICLYLHAGRGMYYSSFILQETWSIGVLILLLTMGAAFLGYVLPWGQMSFWGTTVITNLLSALPYVGENIVMWLWGGFAVGNPTLTRFFSFHFLVPFIVAFMAILHLLFLHQTGSNNPLGLSMNKNKVPFHPYFSFKDLVSFLVAVFFLGLIVITSPWLLGDPENFIPANPLVTPIHIQPEWYFLFAYAILRSIPNKLGGVVALAGAIMILWIMPLMSNSKFKSLKFYPLSKFYFWSLVNSVFLLTWIGARPVEEPYVFTGQILTLFYFSYYFLSFYLKYLWDWLTA